MSAVLKTRAAASSKLVAAGLPERTFADIVGLDELKTRLLTNAIASQLASLSALDSPLDGNLGGAGFCETGNHAVRCGDLIDALAAVGVVTYREVLDRFDWSEVPSDSSRSIMRVTGIGVRSMRVLKRHLTERGFLQSKK